MTEGGFFEDIPYENHMKLININIIGVINGIYCAIDLLKNTQIRCAYRPHQAQEL